MKRPISSICSLLVLLCSSIAVAQQNRVDAGAFAIGRGAGVSGYTSLLCAAGQLAVGQAGAPICRTVSGDWSLNAAGVATLATVNANVGAFGSATQSVAFTVNAKGLITAAANVTVTPAVGSITGLGTGVATALGTNVGTPGAPLVYATVTPQGRLTLVTGTPVMTSNVSAVSTMLYTPANGNMVPIYDGTNWLPVTFSELSNVNANSAVGNAGPAAVANNSCYDYFVWRNAGVVTLTRGPAWTNITTRSAGTALTRLNGITLNSVAITNGPAASRGTYVGTACSNGTATFDWSVGGSASGGVAGVLSVWNAYNRVLTAAVVLDTGATYTYTSGTVRQARASAGNQVTIVLGLREDPVIVAYAHREQTVAVSGAAVAAGVCLDVTNAYGGAQSVFASQAATVVATGSTTGQQWQSPIGQHFIAACENSDGANANTFDQGSNNSLMVTVHN